VNAVRHSTHTQHKSATSFGTSRTGGPSSLVGLAPKKGLRVYHTRPDVGPSTQPPTPTPEVQNPNPHCWYLLTQIEYEGFRKRTEYHCSIFTRSILGIVIYILLQENNGVKTY
jgi:hypothetical protein